MIIYENTKSGFHRDVLESVIEDKIFNNVYDKLGRRTARNEVNSWVNSLEYMNGVLSDDDIPNDVGIAIEYAIPYTSKRVDVIISGLDADKQNTAVVVELKQWDTVEAVEDKDGIVRTILGGRLVETTHPSYQAWSYVKVITDFNETVQDRPIIMTPCALLHNYNEKDPEPLKDEQYRELTELAPLFLRKDRIKLQKFIKDHIKYGDNKDTLFLIDSGKLKPSKSLQDSLSKMLSGNEEFIMLDTQKIIFEKIKQYAEDCRRDNEKRVLIVKGGPGTGKSVLAVNLLVDLTGKEMMTKYVTKNQAPRSVYSNKLKGTMKRNSVDNMFGGSGNFFDTEKNTFDVILADEAHRLNEKSGLYQNQGEHQIKEIINASRFSVFFIDEDQRVTLKDVGTIDNIRSHAKKCGAILCKTEELDSQFRCGGSDGYIAWVDDVLQIRETANFDNVDDLNYDIRVFDDPNDMRRNIEERNSVNGRSRIVSGYCWNWITDGKNDPDVHDISIPEFDFGMSWNLSSTSTWAIDEGSIGEAGCIHTCQGLEFDYVGVIIGDDLRYSDNRVITDQTKRAKSDHSLRGLKKMLEEDPEEAKDIAERIIKNTYRTLMTRGMRGCYIYCTDNALKEYLKKRIAMFSRN